jgi:hypothetical protein
MSNIIRTINLTLDNYFVEMVKENCSKEITIENKRKRGRPKKNQ